MAEPLTVLCYNTHVGTNLPGLRRLIAGLRSKPDLVLLQEVNRPLARARARAIFNPTKWSLAGGLPLSTGRGSSGTLVFARRARLSKIGSSNRLVSGYHNAFHPERRITVGRYKDKATGRVLVASSAHTWTMHTDSQDADERAMIHRTHTTQVQRYAAVAQIAVNAGEVVIFAGDWNERVEGNKSTQVERAMSAVGMILARPGAGDGAHLDDVFLNRTTSLTKHARHSIPGGEPQHQAIVARVSYAVYTS